MNILQQEDLIKGLPDQRLMQEAKQPTGQVPQYLVVSELQRRKKMREDFQANQQQMPEGTVADKIIQETEGGINALRPSAGGHPPGGMPQGPGMLNDPNLPQNMSPEQYQQMQNQAILPPGQGMYAGGIVGLAGGGPVRMNNLGAVPFIHNGVRYTVKPQPGMTQQQAFELFMQGQAPEGMFTREPLDINQMQHMSNDEFANQYPSFTPDGSMVGATPVEEQGAEATDGGLWSLAQKPIQFIRDQVEGSILGNPTTMAISPEAHKGAIERGWALDQPDYELEDIPKPVQSRDERFLALHGEENRPEEAVDSYRPNPVGGNPLEEIAVQGDFQEGGIKSLAEMDEMSYAELEQGSEILKQGGSPIQTQGTGALSELLALRERAAAPYPDFSDQIDQSNRLAKAQFLMEVGAGLMDNDVAGGIRRGSASLRDNQQNVQKLDMAQKVGEYKQGQDELDRDVKILVSAAAIEQRANAYAAELAKQGALDERTAKQQAGMMAREEMKLLKETPAGMQMSPDELHNRYLNTLNIYLAAFGYGDTDLARPTAGKSREDIFKEYGL